MSTETPTKERSVPKPVFTDAEAGSKEFPSSNEPLVQLLHAGQARATVYEDVTVDVQPILSATSPRAGSTASPTAPAATRTSGRS
jgi:hypothetical protein